MHSSRVGLPTAPRSGFRAAENSHSDYRRSDDSSSSSAGSSLFDRMNSYASSLTSFDDDYQDSTKPGKGRSLRTRRIEKMADATSPTASLREHGHTVWNRMASAASELTVSVSKAWAANIAIHAGEETPPGVESRLTRAMKAYHREKAQSPEDLPPWLFTDEERRPPPPPIRSPTSPRSHSTEELRSTRKPRGLREIYDAAAATQSQPLTGAANNLRSPPEGPSKATDRLKAIREAKRSAVTGNKSSDYVYQDGRY